MPAVMPRPALLLWFVCVALAGATTKPTTRATTRPVTRPAAEATFASTLHGVSFRVPTAWGRSTVGIAPELLDQVFLFELNGGDARAKAGASGLVRTRLDVAITQPRAGRERLEDVVEDSRAGMQRLEPNATLVDDRAVDVAGQPARLLKWKVSAPSRVTRIDAKGKRSEGPGPTIVFLRQKTLFVRNKAVCDVELIAEEKLFDRLRPVVDRVAASIEPTR